MPQLSQYEKDRLANIERNKALLASLELDIPQNLFPQKEVRRPKKPAAPKKRRAEPDENDEAPKESPAKVARTDASDDASGVRRSARNAGKTVDYKSEKTGGLPLPLSVRNRNKKPGNAGPLGEGKGGKKMCVFFIA
jgi:E3 ubiquitin-protein ligase UHRF1